MATVKTQTPLMLGDNYIYPLTTADQVILADGTRLMKNGKIVVNEANHADTANRAENAVSAENALYAENSVNSENANHANSATNATYAENANHANSATNATYAENANHANSATNATTAENAVSATNANHANSSTNADNAAKLNGKTPDYYTYNVSGYAKGSIVNGSGTGVSGHGVANIILRPNGLAEIHYNLKITTAGTESNVFTWGINSYELQYESGMPYVTPTVGGSCTYYRPTGLNEENNGIAGTHMCNGQFWQFARMYVNDGSVGAWPPSMFKVGDRICGVCFGTYVR